MKKIFYTLLLLFTLVGTSNVAFAQDEEKVEDGWKKGAGIGLDLSQLVQINPKQGAGQNSLGLGGAINFFANLKDGRLAWDNLGLFQFGIQRLGSGLIAQGAGNAKIPFQKAIDELRFNSKIGYQTSEESKLFYAADFSFMSQLTSTYVGDGDFPGNYLTELDHTSLKSKLFSPATITLSLGLDYKFSDNLSIFFSPLGSKFIIVADDNIAALDIHGNPHGENVFKALGALARINYVNKFAKDKVGYTTSMSLFSNYLKEPQNIDVDWVNEFSFQIFKGLAAAVTLNVFYDHDVKVQITDFNKIGGVDGLGRRVSLTEQFLLKYTKEF